MISHRAGERLERVSGGPAPVRVRLWAGAEATVPARLGLWDAISLIVGIIIGVGIYKAPGDVFPNVSGPWAALGVWLLGGLLSLLGALCWAELASAYPRSGGEFVYLSRAFGPGAGFLFAWAQLTSIRTAGSIAAPAYVFAETAAGLIDLGPRGTMLVAAALIAVLTLLNALGTEPGKWAQNLLTAAKVLSLVGIVAAGLLVTPPTAAPSGTAPGAAGVGSLALAMVFVFYAFDGWNEAAYVASEVRDARRNLPLALLLGTGAVTVIYLLVNLAYLRGLGFEAARTNGADAGTLLSRALGAPAARVIAVLILVAILGALNGTILTGSRLFAEFGASHRVFAPLARWDRGGRAPVGALVAQAGVSIALVLAVGLYGKKGSGFEQMVNGTAPVFWLFLCQTGVALFVLRVREPHVERPFRVPLYPLTPLLFCLWSGYMVVGSVRESTAGTLVALIVLLTGAPLYLLAARLDGRPATPSRSSVPPAG